MNWSKGISAIYCKTIPAF